MMDWRRPLLSLLWIVILPLVLAGALRALSMGPDVEDVREQLGAEERHQQRHALQWATLLRQNSLLADMEPLLADEDEHIRENTAESLRAYNSPRMLDALEKGIYRYPGEARDYLKAMYSTSDPRVLEVLERISEEHPDGGIRDRAFGAGEYMEFVLNQREGYFSLGNHIWNPLGQYLSTQASLFPEGRALIELGPAPGSHQPGMTRPWIQKPGGKP